KADFQKLADMRIREAGILLKEGEFDGAYYIAGYAVECALKACFIQRKVIALGLWPDKKIVNDCHTHNLKALVKLADLETEIDAVGQVTVNWATAKDWTEDSRYDHGKTELFVRQFFDAITHPTNGVLQWLKERW